MKDKEKTVYYRFVEHVLKALKIAHVRRYPHKHDPKKYGVWAHVALFALKQLEDKSYHFIVEMVSEMPRILSLLEIAQAPHRAKLCSFFDAAKQLLSLVFVLVKRKSALRFHIETAFKNEETLKLALEIALFERKLILF